MQVIKIIWWFLIAASDISNRQASTFANLLDLCSNNDSTKYHWFNTRFENKFSRKRKRSTLGTLIYYMPSRRSRHVKIKSHRNQQDSIALLVNAFYFKLIITKWHNLVITWLISLNKILLPYNLKQIQFFVFSPEEPQRQGLS